MLSIILIWALGILIYSNSFTSSFHFDDVHFIVENLIIRNIHHLQDIWNYWPCRFITFFSFALNYHFNQLNVFGYHLFNLGVHLITSLLVWWFVRLTLSTPAMKEQAISQHVDFISLLVGLVFAVHPIQTQAVNFIWQRAASMAALFYLAALCFYVKSRMLGCYPEQREVSCLSYILSLVFAVTAMFTKENTITLFPMILFYEIFFLKEKKSFHWKSLGPFLFVLLVIPAVWVLFGAERFQARQSFVTNISSLQYLLTEFRVMLTYIRLVFWPLHQNLDYDFTLSKTVFAWPEMFSFISIVGILFFAKRIFLKQRLISFSIFWFFLTLLPESSFFPFADVIFEHRLYLPMVGASVFLISGGFYLLQGNIRSVVIIFVILITGCAFLTYQRNNVWKTDIVLWSDVIKKSPQKARGYTNLGIAYFNESKFDQALESYNQSVKLDPFFTEGYYNRGVLYRVQGRYKQAVLDFSRAIDLNPYDQKPYYSRGLIYARQGNFNQAIVDYTKAIGIDPHFAGAYVNRGVVYDYQGDLTRALSDFNQAIKIDPEYAEAYCDRANVYSQQKDFSKAILDYNKALDINPHFLEVYHNRDFAYSQLRKLN